MFYIRVIDSRGRRPYGSIKVAVWTNGFFSGGRIAEGYADNDGVFAVNRDVPFDGTIYVEGKKAFEGMIDSTSIAIEKVNDYEYHRIR